MSRKKKPVWTCNVPECKNKDKKCEHLEALMPKIGRGISYFNDMLLENHANVESISKEEQEAAMKHKLRAYAIPEHYVDILVLKFVYSWTWNEITEQLHIPNVGIAYKSFKKALSLLKERGYKKYE